MAAFTLIWIKGRRLFQITDPTYFPAEWTHTDGAGVVSQHRLTIGELFIFRSQVEITADMRGRTIYFCPSTFVQLNTTNRGYYKFTIPSTAIVNDLIQAVWTGASVTQDNRDVNFSVDAVGATSRFTIQHTIIVGADNKGFYQNTALVNHDKLLKNAVDNPTELNNNHLNDFYHATPIGEYRFSVSLKQNSGATIVEETEFPVGAVQILGCWYNKENDNNAPPITSPVWSFEDESGNPVTCLGLLQDTKVTLQCRFTGITPIGFCLSIIETNSYDDTVVFWNNYAMPLGRYLLIKTVGGTGNLNGKFRAPSNLWVNLGVDLYETDLFIKASGLDPLKKYRLIANCYSDNNDKMTSFISEELSCCATPPKSEIADVTTQLHDYNDNKGYAINGSVIKNRLLHKVEFGGASIANWLIDITTNLGSGVLVKVVPKKVEYIQVAISGYFNVLDYRRWDFVNWLYDGSQYFANFGAAGSVILDDDSFKMNEVFSSDDGVTLSDWLEMNLVFRNRYESNVSNINSYDISTLNPLGAQSNQDWVGLTVSSVYMVEIEITFTLGGVTYTYIDKHCFQANDTGVSNAGEFTVTMYQDDDTTVIADGNICGLSTVRIKIDSSGGALGGIPQNVIAVIDYTTQSISHVEEDEGYSPTVIVQKNSAKITGDTVTVGDIAWLTLDVTQLDDNKDYYLSIILIEE